MEARPKIIPFFWTFLFLAILLQLSTAQIIPFGTALLYTLSVLATFKLYFHYASQPLVKRFVAERPPISVLLYLVVVCMALALALAAQGYTLAKLTMPEASIREVVSDWVPTFFGLLFLSGFVSCLHYLFDKYKESLVQEKEIEVLRRKSLEMEMNLLRNQLSPHFTFNVLNNLHFLIHKDKDEALYLLSTYSKILRYYVYESRKKTIAFNQEINFLKEYFNLQIKQRAAELQIASTTTPTDDSFCIAPFILATFVENAFKHVLPNTANEYYITQTYSLTRAGKMTFEITNTFHEAGASDEYSGVGLKHVRESLALAYPDSHQLHLQQERGVFAVKLELQLRKC